METLVIYKELGKLKVTPASNYDAHILDARKIQDASAFESPKEIIDYYVKWFGSSESDFLVKC